MSNEEFKTRLIQFTSLESNSGESPLWGHFLCEYIEENLAPTINPVITTVVGDPLQSIIQITELNRNARAWVKEEIDLKTDPPPKCPIDVYWPTKKDENLIFHDLKGFEVEELEISSAHSSAVYFKYNNRYLEKGIYKILILDKVGTKTIPNNAKLHIYIKLKKLNQA